jgi:acetylglutamate kinase
MTMLTVIKIGGHVIDDEAALHRFLEGFAAMAGPKVLVHGGGKMATAMARALGMETRMVDGRRITDEDTLRVVTMTYAGWIGKRIAAKLTAQHCPAVSLCGADGGIMPSKRRAAVPIDHGHVGDPVPQHRVPDVLGVLLKAGYAPVIAPITADANGQLLNTNADTVAASLAGAFVAAYPVRLLLAFEKEGVLGADGRVWPTLDASTCDELIANGTVRDGMRPKLTAAFGALDRGVSEVWIGAAERLVYGTEGAGATRLVARKKAEV